MDEVAAVAGRRVEQAVAGDRHRAAVVVDVAGLLDLDDLAPRAAGRLCRVLPGALELVDLDVSLVVREVDVELARASVVRREGDREEAGIVDAAVDHAAHVEEGAALFAAVE